VPTPTSVEDYIAGLADDRRAGIEELRRTIRAAAPDAGETISYQMPTFTSRGRFLVSYAAFKDHYSLFPASDAVVKALGADLTPFITGRATIRFPARAPIPTDVVARVVTARLAEDAARPES